MKITSIKIILIKKTSTEKSLIRILSRWTYIRQLLKSVIDRILIPTSVKTRIIISQGRIQPR
jgi:hypothetical protein